VPLTAQASLGTDGLEQLDGVAREILDQDLPDADAGHDVVAEATGVPA
jgi:hypothetical protein